MSTLPVDNTARLVFHYEGSFGAHTFMIRAVTDSAALTLAPAVHAVLDANAGLWNSTVSFTACDLYLEGNAYSNPLTWAPIAGTSMSDVDPVQRTRYVSMTGRGVTGHRSRVFFYGIYGFSDQADYRLTTGEYSALDDFRADLVTLYPASGACDINHSQVVWHPYWNVGYNAYYQRKARTTG